MFSGKKGKPIAVIKGGKYDGNIIYVDDAQGALKKTTSIELSNGEMRPIPDPDGRQCLYIAAPSGSGKTTYVGEYARAFRKIFPKSDIYLFSKIDAEDEPAFKGLKMISIALNEELITEPIEMDEFPDWSLVIFDDCDTISNNKIKESVMKTKNSLLELGRHNNIYVIVTSHLINKGYETKTVINEAHMITIFPSSGSFHNIEYFLKNNIGMSKKDIQKILKLQSRWVTIVKNYPQCVFYQTGGYILSGSH